MPWFWNCRSILINEPLRYADRVQQRESKTIIMSEQTQNCKPCPEGRIRDESGKCVMPEVTFTSFVLSLNTTALYHLGELAHPETGERAVDLELVKHTIDTLVLLR